jgi:uncharacterized protein YbjT (DUF2867 family)
MKILITGATGFIGSHLRRELAARGHALLLASRRPPADSGAGETWVRFDLASPPAAGQIASWLHGVDAVVNAAGIFKESRSGPSFRALHTEGPQALFAACLASGVVRVVQVSALGADDAATSEFHRSKRAADEFLLSLPLSGVVVQPSLVFGTGGGSAELFTRLAALPVVPLPAGGNQRVQPIHIDDVTAALVALVETAAPRGRMSLVGPHALSLREYLGSLRTSLGAGPARFVSVPATWVARAARLGDRIERAPLDSDAWQMLQRGNTASAAALAALLGRPPREASAFISPDAAPALRLSAQMAWLAPLLRVSIAGVWLVTGVLSLGIYPVSESHALLARAGVAEPLRPAALYGAAVLDLVLGVATLAVRRRTWVWLAQIALILAYTVIISVRLPEFWLHPYGPVLKNLPMLAALLLLLVIERPAPGARRGL